jgi:hypothetical protein
VHHRRVIHLQKAQSLQVEYPHRDRIGRKHQPETLFAVTKCLFRGSALIPKFLFFQRVANGHRQSRQLVLEDVVTYTSSQAFDRQFLAQRAGHQDHRRFYAKCPRDYQGVESGPVWKTIVREDEVEGFAPQAALHFFGGGGDFSPEIQSGFLHFAIA